MRARIDAAARTCGRSDRPALLAVTKSIPPAVARALVELGQVDLGENRLQVLEPKREAFVHRAPTDDRGHPLAPRWHFVGHLQRNKAARVLGQVDALHSVDSPRLVEALVRADEGLDHAVDLFLQVKLCPERWPEESKGGLAVDELEAAFDALAACTHLRPVGLMTMAPLVEDGEAARAAAAVVFGELADVGRRLAGLPWSQSGGASSACDDNRPTVLGPALSMGMSDDLEAAVAAGSHWLRVGRALFRDLPDPTTWPNP
ncbi:Pyridoxal phosphate homeostasis protein [Planctomycetes bacterium Pla163]|uniref:Pyridoxal phosphate homeostasis protein n=1 Tax=Rohdeia mirabilis TaxID=2528008 RepID=A0A518CZZ3_9BACT|nr:Pyridoxal phosphate homeostasis protein [Planctomycetes bacterium Pla163]